MTADLDLLVTLLGRERGIDEWQACETQTDRTTVAEHHLEQSRRHTLTARLFRDSDEGRGEATFEVGLPLDRAALVTEIRRAIDAAAMATGPLWASPPPSAPAQVTVADPRLADDATGAAQAALDQLTAAAPGAPAPFGARVEVTHTTHRAASSRGFDSAYRKTRIDCAATLDPRTAIGFSSRQLLDGAVAEEVATRRRRADQLRRAEALPSGRYDVVFTERALSHGGFGVFAPYVAHAQPYWRRLGLTGARRRSGTTATSTAPARGGESSFDQLTLSSDGTLPFGLRSAPFEPLGDPVRRFELVQSGRAVGVATDPREAALLGVVSRGRVRNLVVAAGRHPEADLVLVDQRPVVVIEDLVALEVDPQRGHFTARIGAATLHGMVKRGATPARDGWVSGNVFDLFESASLSAEVGGHGCYVGPRRIRLRDLELIGGVN